MTGQAPAVNFQPCEERPFACLSQCRIDVQKYVTTSAVTIKLYAHNITGIVTLMASAAHHSVTEQIHLCKPDCAQCLCFRSTCKVCIFGAHSVVVFIHDVRQILPNTDTKSLTCICGIWSANEKASAKVPLALKMLKTFLGISSEIPLTEPH